MQTSTSTGGVRDRVRVLGKYYAPFSGGIEQVCKASADALARDYQVEVLAFAHDQRSGSEGIDGVTVRRFATQAVVASQPISLGYALAILKDRYDLLIVHAPNVLASLFWLVRKMLFGQHAKLIVVHHMDMHGRALLRAPARWLYDRMIAAADRVVVTSRKNAAISNDIRRECAIEAIPLGIDPANYTLAQSDRDAALEWRSSLAGTAPVVGFVGRHARYKGLDVLLRALAEDEIAHVHALIGGDGEETPMLKALAAKLGIADRVHFLGRLTHTEKLGLLATVDVFAFPSTETTEAFGIAQLEAMQMGAPLVASDLPSGVSDVSINGDTALTVTPGDHEHLAHAILRIIDSPVLAERLTTRARKTVRGRFTTQLMIAGYRNLVQEVMAE